MDIVWSKDRSQIGTLATDIAEIANSLRRGDKEQAIVKFRDFEQVLRHSANRKGDGITNLEVYPYINNSLGAGLILRGTAIEVHVQKDLEDVGNNFGLRVILYFIERFCSGELGNKLEGFEKANNRLMSGLNSGEIPIIRGMVGEFQKWNRLLDNIFKADTNGGTPKKVMEIDRFLSNTGQSLGLMNVEGVNLYKNIITKTDVIISLRP